MHVCIFLLEARFNLFSTQKVSFEVFFRNIIRTAQFSRHVTLHPSEICRVYDHASHWKPLNRYTLHSCSHYLTMLMLRGWKSQRGVAKSYNAY